MTHFKSIKPWQQKELEDLFARDGWKFLGVIIETPSSYRCVIEKDGQRKTAKVYFQTGIAQPERKTAMLDVDYVQFARLLDEINAAGLTEDQMKTVAKSMELQPEAVQLILNRASSRWDDLKPLLSKTTPLTEEQISEELAEHGTLNAIVTMDFEEIVGQLEDAALDGVFDELAERVAGDVALSDIDYKVLFADKDTLYIKVTAKADGEEDDEDIDVE